MSKYFYRNAKEGCTERHKDIHMHFRPLIELDHLLDNNSEIN